MFYIMAIVEHPDVICIYHKPQASPSSYAGTVITYYLLSMEAAVTPPKAPVLKDGWSFLDNQLSAVGANLRALGSIFISTGVGHK